MPNWCMNELTISSDKEGVVDAIVEAIESKPGARDIDFNKIVPMPSIFENMSRDIRSGKTTKCDIELDSETGAELRTCRDATPKEVAEYDAVVAETGCDGWYAWCVENCGVKWNASSVDSMGSDDHYAEYHFDTPWGPPEQIVQALSEQYPDAGFTLFFREDGMQFSGYING